MAVLNQLIAKEIPLDTLPLNNRYRNDKLADSQVFPLFEVLGHGFPNCPFTTLDLSYNYIRNAGAKAIAVYLTQTNTLTSLNLSGNKVEQLGVEKLSQSLYGQKTLKCLDLSHNPVGDEGMAKLAASLTANGTLEAMNMANTDLGTVSLMKLASMLRSNGSLIDLNVASPLLYSREEETTIAIAKALADNTTLQSLNMAHHRMEDFGVGWLADYLVKNSGLTSLDLSCNRITATGVAQLAKAIAVRSVPCTIRLNGCPLRGREHDEIFEEIEIADAEGSPMAVTFVSEDEAHELVSEPRG
jgi:Ran GTPase-activating protein (RanGAP) involved in mRNA processing and transport